MKPVIIYALTRRGKVIYIGRTGRLGKRLSEHRSGKVAFDGCRVLARCAVRNAVTMERRYISTYKPALNKRRGGEGSLSWQDASIAVWVPTDTRDWLRGEARRRRLSVAGLCRHVLLKAAKKTKDNS